MEITRRHDGPIGGDRHTRDSGAMSTEGRTSGSRTLDLPATQGVIVTGGDDGGAIWREGNRRNRSTVPC